MPPSSRPISSLSLSFSAKRILASKGYEQVGELHGVTEDEIKALNLAPDDSIRLLNISQRSSTLGFSISLSQSAAKLATTQGVFSTGCAPLDQLLSGGMKPNHVLEISGPPGSAKEILARNIVRSFASSRDHVLFVDLANMTGCDVIESLFKDATFTYASSVYHHRVLTLPDFVVFLHKLPALLTNYPKIRLLVFGSIHFPFQTSAELHRASRYAWLQQVKKVFASIISSQDVSIVTTSQLSIKIKTADNSIGTFETGGLGVMEPQLDESYLPAGRAYRVIIAPDSRTSGQLRLLSAPNISSEKGPNIQVPYHFDGCIVSSARRSAQ